MNTVIMDIIRIGLAATVFHVVMVFLLNLFPIPGLHQIFMA
ncbi:MAG: hypothetical protein ACTHMU_20875 [Thermomicrobiales bacterium]